MNIAFLNYYPKEELKSHHGYIHYMAQSLFESGHNIIFIDDLKSNYQSLYKIKSFYHKYISKRNYFRLMDKPVTRDIGYQATKKLSKHTNIDLVLATGSIELAYLKTDIPVVLWTDTPFVGLLNYYDAFTNLPEAFIKQGIEFDKLAHEKSRYIIYPSQWAVKLAAKEYGITTEKFKHIGFGASIDDAPEEQHLNEILEQRLTAPLTLFFAGIEWERKGGKYIFGTLERLKNIFPDVKLKIAGIVPDIQDNLKDNVEIIPFLNKQNPDEYKKLIGLYLTSHFFIMPSLAETFGVVFAEAASYGLPVISSDTGGIPSVVINDKNGFTFKFDDNIEEKMCNKIAEMFSDKTKYLDLCKSSLNEYKTRLNWKASAQKFNELIANISGLE